MLKKILALIFAFVLLVSYPISSNVSAQSGGYKILNFDSLIKVNKDTSLTITEKILVNFAESRHGIFRIIPNKYTVRGRTIDSRIKILSIKDGSGNNYKYERSSTGQSIKLKIGDADTLVNGSKTYVITYEVRNVLQKYENGYELYWNVTGHEWDGEILSATAGIESDYADITNTTCYSGTFGTVDKGCRIERTENNNVRYNLVSPLNYGEDFTVVSAFSNANTFTPPGRFQKTLEFLSANWGYLVSPLPLYLILYFWYKRGRDKKNSGENIYYKEENSSEIDTPLFAREHLPLVYHPIDGLTPAEIGVIVDEKVDIEDILAEITELARLKFFEIRRIVKDRFLKDEVEYAFIKLPKYDNPVERAKLNDYQEYLLKEIFRSTIIHKSIEVAEKFFKGNEKELADARKHLINKDYVLLGGLKNHFYEGLPVFKDKLYARMESKNYFYENPEKVRGKWISMYVVMGMLTAFVLGKFGESSGNYGPLITMFLVSLPGLPFAFAMPRRTPLGHSLKRQIEGLSWYLEKGKWRYEIEEKNLFIEEVLPISIALGVVDKLAKEMSEIGVKPPSYFAGFNGTNFGNDFSSFRTLSTNSFFSTPGGGKWSGSSSWSGGSGFSGGSSGGGFGGGGGGSW